MIKTWTLKPLPMLSKHVQIPSVKIITVSVDRTFEIMDIHIVVQTLSPMSCWVFIFIFPVCFYNWKLLNDHEKKSEKLEPLRLVFSRRAKPTSRMIAAGTRIQGDVKWLPKGRWVPRGQLEAIFDPDCSLVSLPRALVTSQRSFNITSGACLCGKCADSAPQAFHLFYCDPLSSSLTGLKSFEELWWIKISPSCKTPLK